MHRTLLSCFLILALFSCSSSGSGDPAEVWTLTAVYSHQTDTLEQGEGLSIQESLYFYSNGSFLKLRFMEGERYEARGRYFREMQQGQQAYRVEYDQNGLLVLNCFGQPTEHFIFESPGLVQRDGIPCDGPEYRYEPEAP